jgi:NADH-quinone oxidoreductase subunit K
MVERLDFALSRITFHVITLSTPSTGAETMVPLTWYLILAAGLFCVGVFGALARRNAVGVLMGIELMLNAVNINLVAFWRYTDVSQTTGQMFAIFVIAVAAAEAAVGLALLIAIYRQRNTVNVEELDLMKG